MNSQMNRISDSNLVVLCARRLTTSGGPMIWLLLFKSLEADVDHCRADGQTEGLKKNN
jgi:hypothetical protein